eukprot:1354709-Lingulodinium_polyedra.AAC.1
MGTHPCPGHCLRARGQCRAPAPRWADDLQRRCVGGGSNARGVGAWPASPPVWRPRCRGALPKRRPQLLAR